MTFRLPHLFIEDHQVHQNFEKLARAMIDTGDQLVGIRFGSGQITYPGGSAVSDAGLVSHGLGKAPVAMFCQSQGVHHYVRPITPTSTTFTAQGRTLDGTSPAAATTVDFYWLVIG
jgi:hypothetical protein